jgi:ribonuclease HI
MERFNMPEAFIDYVLSGLDNAPSQVKTHGGLTHKFTLMSSVRQGDPLAPLIYALVTDALHEGLRNNPLYPDSTSGGYTFKHHPSATAYMPNVVHSCGYADDMATVSSDPKGCREQHEWVRAFFGAHAAQLNVTKTKYLCSDPSLTVDTAPQIFSIDGANRVLPLVKGESIRYLGIMININLDWSKQRGLMTRAVQQTCNSIRRYRFTIPMSVYAVQQQLLPRLRMGILFARLRKADLQTWDKQIRQAVYEGCRSTMGPSALKDALYLSSGMPLLEDHAAAICIEELLVTLNADYPSTNTCWARLADTILPDATRKRSTRAVDVIANLATLGERISVKMTPQALRLPNTGIERSEQIQHDWDPNRLPTLAECRSASSSARAYTDGSTEEDRKAPSGVSVVFSTPEGEEGPTHGIGVTTMGNNYIAEQLAILWALVLTPSEVDLTIFTDSQSSIDAINSGRGRDPVTGEYNNIFYTSRRKKILNAGRPILNLQRAMISARRGKVHLIYVRAHTGGTDLDSRGNEAADLEANHARVKATKNPLLIPPSGFAGEERVSLVLRGWTNTGSYRKSLLFEAGNRSLERLKTGGKGHQRKLAEEHERRLVCYYAAVRRSHDPELFKFALLATTRWLPVEANLLSRDRTGDNMGRGGSCKICGVHMETVEHALCDCVGADTRAPKAQAIKKSLEALNVQEAPDDAPPTVMGQPHRIRAFFDPTGNTKMDICPEVEQWILDDIEGHDPYAGFLGICPPNLDKALCWVKAGCGWRKLSLGDTQTRVSKLQDAIMWGSLRVWQARCRAMHTWFTSDAAARHRAAAIDRIARRRRYAPAKTPKADKKLQRFDPYPRKNPRPQRSTAAKALQMEGPMAFYVRQELDEICIEAEIREGLLQDSKKGLFTIPWY